MTRLTADAVGDKHRYLAHARPEWSRTMGEIRRAGGPWLCPTCQSASLLIYRCSACGRDLAEQTGGEEA